MSKSNFKMLSSVLVVCFSSSFIFSVFYIFGQSSQIQDWKVFISYLPFLFSMFYFIVLGPFAIKGVFSKLRNSLLFTSSLMISSILFYIFLNNILSFINIYLIRGISVILISSILLLHNIVLYNMDKIEDTVINKYVDMVCNEDDNPFDYKELKNLSRCIAILRILCIVFIEYYYVVLLCLTVIVILNILLFYKIKYYFISNISIIKKSKKFFVIEIVMYYLIGILSTCQFYSLAIITILLSGFKIPLLRGILTSQKN